ncbi:MAG TPA: response regulator [Thermoanaerobaculia bacterium]|nr:response regulator [Thermoanaerobaculia bacterium]
MTEGAGLLQEAVQAAKRGDGGAARSLLLRASESEPGNDLVWLWLAHLSTSPADKASYLRRVLAIHPGHEVARAELADALRSEGVAAAKGGARRRARELLESSIELDDGKEDSWLWLAAVAETKEQRRACLERVLAIDPGHRHALALLDLPELRQAPKAAASPPGEVAAAAGAARRCPLCRGVGFSGARCSWCRSLFALDDLRALVRNAEVDREMVGAGLRRLEGLPGGRDNFDVQLAFGLGLLNLGRIDEGIPHLEIASRLRPDDAVVAAQLDVLKLWRRGRQATARPARRGSVLVVDDSPTVLKLVASSLEPHGFEVTTAAAGLEALARLREKRPNLVLLDINLPGMDGYQVCKIIKADPNLGKVPVVFLSGRGGLFDRMRGRLAGSSEHVQKPFEPQALLALVERFVELRNQVGH